MSKIVELLLDNARQDTDLLIQNDDLGDIFSIPRNVDFAFYATEADRAELVANFINDNQYAEASFEKIDEEYKILAVVHMPPTQNILCSVSALMTFIAELFSVEYDGWETTIEDGKQ